jgi:hypothetical protein
MSTQSHEPKEFKIYRSSQAPTLAEAGCMSMVPFSPDLLPALQKMAGIGMEDGQDVRVLVNIPGFSLTHVWFKRDYPLPLHSHDADCLYYIIAGSLKLGKEELGPRDAFFVPADAPYTYRAGPDGVELLEFRHATQFNFVNRANSEAFWTKAYETVKANRESWQKAKMPALNV